MPLTRVKNNQLSGSIATSKLASGSSFLTSVPSSILPAGTSLQTLSDQDRTASVVSASSGRKWMEVALTTKKANSDFDVTIAASISMPDAQNRDSYNYSLHFGYKTGAASGTAGDYTAIGGRSGTSAANYEGAGLAVSGGGTYPLWNSDVVLGMARGTATAGVWGTDYNTNIITHKVLIDLSQAAGTQIQFALWLRHAATMTINGVHYDHEGNDYNGSCSSLTVTEVST